MAASNCGYYFELAQLDHGVRRCKVVTESLLFDVKPLLRDRLTRSLLEEVAAGRYLEGRRLLARRRIQRIWGVSRETAELAMGRLVAGGILVGVNRKLYVLAPGAADAARNILKELRVAPLPVRSEFPDGASKPGRRRGKDVVSGGEGLLHEHLFKSLLVEIASGWYREGTRFLSRGKIERMWHVSRPTVERARSRLVDHGILCKTGTGTLQLAPGGENRACLLLERTQLSELPAPESWRTRSRRLVGRSRSEGYRFAVIHDERSADPVHIREMERNQSWEALVRERFGKRYLVAFLREANRHFCETLFFYDDGRIETRREILARIAEARVEGVAVFQKTQFFSRKPLLSALRKPGLPVVTAMDDCEGEADASIDCNETVAGYQAMKILLEHGHRSIYLLDGSEKSWPLRRRLEGALMYLRESGMEKDVILRHRRFEKPFRWEATLGRALRSKSRPTALLFLWGRMLPACDPVLQRTGLRVPRDLSVIGCGTPVFESQLFGPPDLLMWDTIQIGETAARQLLSLANGEAVPRTTQLEAPYLRRGTVCPPKGRRRRHPQGS